MLTMRRRRWRSRTEGKRNRGKVFLVLFVIFSLFMLQTFIYIERNLRDPLMEIASIRIKQMATEAINNAVTDKISRGTDTDKLIDWKTDENGKVAGFMLNYAEHMRIASETEESVTDALNKLSEKKEAIPLGQAVNSAILASFGPDIPIRFVPAGAVKIDLNTKQIDAGINMLIVEVYIRIIVEMTIIIPFETQPEIVSTDVPITYLLVVGDVPMYYYDAKGNPIGDAKPLPPTVSLPDLGNPFMGSEKKSGVTETPAPNAQSGTIPSPGGASSSPAKPGGKTP